MATLTLLILIIFSSMVWGQQTTNRLDVVYSGATPGRIRGFEQGNPKSNYIDLIWPSSLAANYTLTMPKETSTLLAQENHFYGSTGSLVFYRANGTEASPTDIVDGNFLFSFGGGARIGGVYQSAANLAYIVETASPLTTQIWLSTSNAGSYGVKLVMDGPGSLIPQSTTQDLGSTVVQWRSLYLDGTAPIFFDRSTRSTNQSTVWSIAGTTTGTGTWTLGMQPNVSESSFHITHAGNNRLILLENGQLDLSGPAINATSANASFSIVNAVGSPAYRVNGTTIVDASRNATFVNLTLTGTCTGCPAGSPPVDWWLDSGADVVTLGNHGTVAASQLVTKFSRGTHASPTDAVDTDQVFGFKMQYYAGGAYRDAAAIFGYATATPSGTSSPGKLSFYVTPTGSISGVERFYIDDVEAWFHSSISGNWPLNIRNTSSSGYSAIAFFSHSASNSGYVGWNNSAASINASTFTVGTRSNDLMGFMTQETIRWTLSNTGFVPATDGGQVIGTVSSKPSEIYSRVYKSYTASGYGTQTSELVADANLNLHLITFSSAAATDRASIQMHKYRGSVASPSTVVNGDRLGNMVWMAYTSGGLAVGAVIEAYASNTVSSSVVPTEIRFRTSNSAGTLADRMTILTDGDVNMSHGLTVTNTINSTGSPAYRVSGQTVIDGSRNLTTGNINPITGATYDIGSTSGAFASIYAATALYVYTSGVTRFSASGSGVLVYSSGGVNTFGVTASSGNIATLGSITGGSIFPITNATYDIGNTSSAFANIYAATALYVYTSSVTRFSASGSGILVYTSGGINTFSVTASSGNVASSGTVAAGSNFIAGGNSGISTTLSVRDAGGGADCTVTVVGGIITASTC